MIDKVLATILLILIVLWFFGYVHISGISVPDITLFFINGQPVTLWNLLILVVLISLIGALPSPFRQIAAVFIILWILATVGIIALAGLSQLILIAVIVGLIFYLLGWHS